MKLYNTLTKSVQPFISIKPHEVGLYACGPTVYDFAHIGHMRKYVGDDILVRVLQMNGFSVNHVMNITDVGHLVSDEDTGEDKMEKGAKKYGLTVWDIAKKFEKQFFDSTAPMAIKKPTMVMHATDFINEQIELIETLEKKGFTYQISDGVYFDTSKFPEYFALSRQNPDELKKGARVDFIKGKKNVADFALWKFSPIVGEQRQMEWESPWGVGFPGWHIECSAMSMKALGNHVDIHTGGIDHIPVHHSNEIAQSEAATGEKFVNFWVHHNHMAVEGQKMSKSLGNFITVEDVRKKGFDPLSLRYLFLQTHYRQEMNFTWESLEAAQKALHALRRDVTSWSDDEAIVDAVWIEKFKDAISDDMNMAKALAVVWDLVKDKHLSDSVKRATMVVCDEVLGIDMFRKEVIDIPADVMILLDEREHARLQKDYSRSDVLREQIRALGFDIKDTKNGYEITKLSPK